MRHGYQADYIERKGLYWMLTRHAVCTQIDGKKALKDILKGR
jgi:hypothetical protein